jgi:hypothetical protein
MQQLILKRPAQARICAQMVVQARMRLGLL